MQLLAVNCRNLINRFVCVCVCVTPCLVRCFLIHKTCITHCYHITASIWCGHLQNTFQARVLQYTYICYPCAKRVAVLFVGFSWSVLTVIYIELSNLFFWNKFPTQKFNLFLVHTVILMVVVSIDGREFFDQMSEWQSFVVHLLDCVVKHALWIIWVYIWT